VHSFAVAHEDYDAALEYSRAHGVEITFAEDGQGGVRNGPRAVSVIPTASCWNSSI
jgi:hypothetical protein